jgi:uncharacterized cupin superfamily protein
MTTERRHPHIVNVEDVAAREETRGDFAYRSRRLGTEAGGKALGCSWYELAPGKTSFPFHWHSAFEEGLYVLEGTGTLRIGKDTAEVRAGDYVAFPAGPDAAHQLANTGAAPLRYLVFSAPGTPTNMDICVYPDSNKVAFASGVDPVKGFRGGAWIMQLIKQEQPKIDYYDDEPLAKK